MPEDKIPKIVIIVIASILVLGTALGGYFVWKQKSDGNFIACTEEAKICPDGSAVGRTGPNCEFAACPDDTSDFTPSDIEGWKTYRNEEYGFEVKYPPDGEISEQNNYVIDIYYPRGEDGYRVLNLQIRISPGDLPENESHYSENDNIIFTTFLGHPARLTKTDWDRVLNVLRGDFNYLLWYIPFAAMDLSPEDVATKQDYVEKNWQKILSTFKFIDSGFKTSGTVSGKVSIGPLCPVEPCPGMVPDIYSPLRLVFTPQGGGRPVDLPFYAQLSSDGSYFIELPESNYSVTLSKCDYLGCAYALPKNIFIKANEAVQLNIEIDTGIR